VVARAVILRKSKSVLVSGGGGGGFPTYRARGKVINDNIPTAMYGTCTFINSNGIVVFFLVGR